jgi:beta-N-acetylhexosaminidase
MPRHLLLIALVLAATLCPAKTKEQDRFLRAGPIHLDKSGKKWADKTLRHMSTEEKVGQLFGIKVLAQFLNDADPRWIQLRDEVRKYHVGSLVMTVPVDGAVLLRSQPYVAAELLNRLQRSSKLPLLVSADFERGVSMRLNGTTVFPHAMAFGATGKTENAEVFARISALEARAIGVHWNFFPIADVNSNPANPIINTRSFRRRSRRRWAILWRHIFAALTKVGCWSQQNIFPGTATPRPILISASRKSPATARGSIRWNWLRFERAIEAGVDAVMVAHVTVPALDSESQTVSPQLPRRL